MKGKKKGEAGGDKKKESSKKGESGRLTEEGPCSLQRCAAARQGERRILGDRGGERKGGKPL